MRIPVRLLIVGLACAGALAAGCSGSSSGSSGSTASSSGSGTSSGSSGTTGSTGTSQPFLGTWQIIGSGSATLSGMDIDGGTQTASGSTTTPSSGYQVTFTLSSSNLISVDSYGCQLSWSVSGTTATLMPNQSCVTSNGGGCSATYSITSGSLSITVVDANHLSGAGNLTGTITSTANNAAGCTGATASAVGQGSGTLIRVGS